MRKGNLIRNGDFESGSLEGWDDRFWGLGDNYGSMYIESGVGYSSGKCLKVYAYSVDEYYVGYNQVFDAEEVAGYIYSFYSTPLACEADVSPAIYYYNEFNDNEQVIWFKGHISGLWKKFEGFIRKINNCPKFSVGFHHDNTSPTGYVRFDSFSLIPIRNINEVTFFRSWSRREGAGEYEDDIYIFCVGQCKIYFTAHVYPHSVGVDSEVDIYVRPLTKDGHKTYNNPIHWTTSENTYVRSYMAHDISGVNIYTKIEDDNSDYEIDYYLSIQPQ